MVNFAMWFQLFHSQHLKTDNINSIHTDGTRRAPTTGDAGLSVMKIQTKEGIMAERLLLNEAKPFVEVAHLDILRGIFDL